MTEVNVNKRPDPIDVTTLKEGEWFKAEWTGQGMTLFLVVKADEEEILIWSFFRGNSISIIPDQKYSEVYPVDKVNINHE